MDSSLGEISAFLQRARAAVETGRIEVTLKADDELIALGWTRDDLFLQLAELAVSDFGSGSSSAAARRWSRSAFTKQRGTHGKRELERVQSR